MAMADCNCTLQDCFVFVGDDRLHYICMIVNYMENSSSHKAHTIFKI
jgi:hypothetical protein